MKKYILILCCVVACTIVLGINARLDYESFLIAFEPLEANALEVYADLQAFKAIVNINKYYDPAVKQGIGWTGTENPDTDNGLPVIAPYYIVLYDGEIEDPDESHILVQITVEPTSKEFSDLFKLLREFEHDAQSTSNIEVLAAVNTVIVYLRSVLLIFRSIITILFDIVEVAFSILNSVFYLVGF